MRINNQIALAGFQSLEAQALAESAGDDNKARALQQRERRAAQHSQLEANRAVADKLREIASETAHSGLLGLCTSVGSAAVQLGTSFAPAASQAAEQATKAGTKAAEQATKQATEAAGKAAEQAAQQATNNVGSAVESARQGAATGAKQAMSETAKQVQAPRITTAGVINTVAQATFKALDAVNPFKTRIADRQAEKQVLEGRVMQTGHDVTENNEQVSRQSELQRGSQQRLERVIDLQHQAQMAVLRRG